MKWKQFTIETTTEAEDILISELADIGTETGPLITKIHCSA